MQGIHAIDKERGRKGLTASQQLNQGRMKGYQQNGVHEETVNINNRKTSEKGKLILSNEITKEK